MTTQKAPWTPEQVEALQLYQNCGMFHPYTCGNRENHPTALYQLVPTVRGWVCQFCDYTQDWALPMMLDKATLERAIESWRGLTER